MCLVLQSVILTIFVQYVSMPVPLTWRTEYLKESLEYVPPRKKTAFSVSAHLAVVGGDELSKSNRHS
eukprot:CAMPEP_0171171388 /NCGR_PEP_ID=MMETSP0790-20130122/9192_1 /TAXON_ID=2925 /ORGANISM="Alexandrium catenella, Strain OF101" /LENGTH=66 /DNA_ID=CAMNT_0011636241 /DNA_START=89 /DNA_END=286 /DNA_ORIENTATION=-